MKAIVVIDMPVNGCESCMFDSYGCRCLIKANMLDTEKTRDSNYCPLKPMPNRIDWLKNGYNVDWIMFSTGWNACLKEIEE